jgi:Uma2 family endonuclease
MGAVLKPTRFANAEEFLAWEASQTERHEYVDGELYAMVGARLSHNTVSLNAYTWLRQALKGSPCRPFALDTKLQLAASGEHLYPDVMVTCDTKDLDGKEDRFIRHPWLVVEVLSDGTAAYDRGLKFELYRSLDSLTHYLLVEQTRPHADLFFKTPAGQWVLQPLALGDALQIERLGQPWPVASLYEDVDFPPDGRAAGMPLPVPDPGR